MKTRFFAGLLCLVMLISMMASITVAADFSAIDLGDTPTTVITVGGTTQLYVNGIDASELTGITYTSSNEDFASVSSTGLVTGNKTGIATITATSGSLSDTILISVVQGNIKTTTFPSGFADDSEIKRAGNITKKFDLSAEKNLAYINYDVLDMGYNTFSFWYYVDGTYNKEMIFRFNKWTNQQEADKQQVTYSGIAPADSTFVNTNFDFDAWDSGYVGFMRQTVKSTVEKGFTGSFTTAPYFKVDAGWHQFVCRITEESLTIYCDGKVVFTGKGRQFLSPANLSVLKAKTSTTGTYNFADKQYYNTGDVEIDVANGTSVARRNITFNVGNNGQLAYWKNAIADDTSLSFSDGYSLKLKATADAEYEVASFKVGEENLTPDSDGYVTFDVTEDTTVDVTFKKIGDEPEEDEDETLTSLDLGDTPTTVVTTGETTQLYINGKDASTIEGVTYTSSNEEFVTVSESGLVTGKKAGIATITATSGSLTDTVLIAVSNTTVKTSKFPSAFVEDTEVKRAGNNTSKHGLTKEGTIAFINYDVLDMGYNTFSFWYYDDGTNNISLQFTKWTNQEEANKQQIAYSGIAPADTTFANSFRLRTRSGGYIGFASNYDNTSWKGFTEEPRVYSYPAETGWHQLVCRITEESLNIYCDGKIVFTGKGRQFISLANLETAAISYGEKAYNLADKQYYNTGDIEIDVTGGTSVARSNVTFNVGDNGNVAYWKSAIDNGAKLSFSHGYNLKLKATPAEGYQIDKFLVGGTEYTPDKDNCVTFVVAEETTSVNVTFKEAVKAPAIARTAVINAASDYNGHPAAITYIRITDGTGISVKEAGIVLGIDGIKKPLKAYSQYTDENNNTPITSGAFAIKVFGNGILNIPCTSQPYVTYNDGSTDKTVYGEEETFEITDKN